MAEVEQAVGPSDQAVAGEIELTASAKRAVELAVDEGRRLQHDYIGTEHLLLGLVREHDGVAARVLAGHGVDLDRVRMEVRSVLGLDLRRAGPPPARGVAEPPGADGPAAQLLEDTKYGSFTEQARRVVMLSQREAQRLRHTEIATEHLLLGLIREQGSIAAKVLENLGVELNKVRRAVEFIIVRREQVVSGEMFVTPRVEKALALAIDEARLLNNQQVGTEHLLLGLICEGEGIAAGVLESLGVNLRRARAETIRLLAPAMPPGAQAALASRPVLGRLLKELRVDKAIRQSGVRLRFQSLEIHTGGFIARLSLDAEGDRPPASPRPGSAVASLVVTDREGRHFDTWQEQGAWDDEEWRLSFRGSPSFRRGHGRVVFWLPRLAWRLADDETAGEQELEGFWAFEITL